MPNATSTSDTGLVLTERHFRGKAKATLWQISSLADRLRRRQIVGSNATAHETALLLRLVVSNAKFNSIEQLLAIVRAVGKQLTAANPKEFAVGNVTRNVLRLIREEYQQALAATLPSAVSSPSHSEPPTPDIYTSRRLSNPSASLSDQLSSLRIAPPPPTPPLLGGFSLLTHAHARRESTGAGGGTRSSSPLGSPPALAVQNTSGDRQGGPRDWDDFNRKSTTVMIQAIQEVIDEIETVYEQVAKNASLHIRSSETILTIGRSRTVESFLKAAAASGGNFTVYVAETAPFYTGHETAASLSSAGIQTVLVPDASIFALMPRISKVVLGTHAVLANGGLVAVSGSALAASVARLHTTPVVVCTGQFKLSPLRETYHEYGAMDLQNPAKVLGFEEGDLVDTVDIAVPYYDYVKPELVDVFITNDGEYPPNSIYRLVKEEMMADDDDHDNAL